MYFDSLENNPSLLTMGRHDMYDDGEQTGKRLHFQTRKKNTISRHTFPIFYAPKMLISQV